HTSLSYHQLLKRNISNISMYFRKHQCFDAVNYKMCYAPTCHTDKTVNIGRHMANPTQIISVVPSFIPKYSNSNYLPGCPYDAQYGHHLRSVPDNAGPSTRLNGPRYVLAPLNLPHFSGNLSHMYV